MISCNSTKMVIQGDDIIVPNDYVNPDWDNITLGDWKKLVSTTLKDEWLFLFEEQRAIISANMFSISEFKKYEVG